VPRKYFLDIVIKKKLFSSRKFFLCLTTRKSSFVKKKQNLHSKEKIIVCVKNATRNLSLLQEKTSFANTQILAAKNSSVIKKTF